MSTLNTETSVKMPVFETLCLMRWNRKECAFLCVITSFKHVLEKGEGGKTGCYFFFLLKYTNINVEKNLKYQYFPQLVIQKRGIFHMRFGKEATSLTVYNLHVVFCHPNCSKRHGVLKFQKCQSMKISCYYIKYLHYNFTHKKFKYWG